VAAGLVQARADFISIAGEIGGNGGPRKRMP
jgi:hypothetical protein